MHIETNRLKRYLAVRDQYISIMMDSFKETFSEKFNFDEKKIQKVIEQIVDSKGDLNQAIYLLEKLGKLVSLKKKKPWYKFWV